MSKTSSNMNNWMNSLIDFKKDAIKTKEYDVYLMALKDAQITFSKMYAESKMEEALKLEEDVLKMIAKEISWVNSKKREKEIPF